jgi:hypothetical protein
MTKALQIVASRWSGPDNIVATVYGKGIIKERKRSEGQAHFQAARPPANTHSPARQGSRANSSNQVR